MDIKKSRIDAVNGALCEHVLNGYIKSLSQEENSVFEKEYKENTDFFISKWGNTQEPFFKKPFNGSSEKVIYEHTGEYSIKNIMIL